MGRGYGLINATESRCFHYFENFCFFEDNVKYLVHIIKTGALAIIEARVESLRQLQHPVTYSN